ncbi:MAG TPA: ASKHA domain-containing protein [Candidatus Sulfomarinibacteraceae bacterium]|nr:ASKHA domain-containing protein [Candidatus Sulfomarinibacteraceae bacterium]
MSDHPLIIFTPAGRRGRVAPGTTVLDAARDLGVQIESICGGRLTCDKCLVRIEAGHFPKYGITSSGENVTPVTADEQEILDEQEPGLRLSCNARVQGDLLVFVPEGSRAQKQMIRKAAGERIIEVVPTVRQVYVEVDEAELGEHRGDWGRLQDALREQWELCELAIDLPALRRLQAALREEEWAVTVTLWQDREVIDVQPGYQEGVYGLAVDIGSTTVAGYLCDLRSGEVLATESAMNPQITYGEDLMSRVSYATMNRQGLKKMHEAIIDTLNRLAASAARRVGLRARDIHELVVVGNTTMMHIFLGIDPVELGQAPFALANRDAMDIKARELGLRMHAGANVHVLPAQAGHVGADNVGVLLAEEPHNQDEMWLVVDVGTNAEIVLGNSQRLYSASSPTGPAFEGAQITHGQRATPGAIERVRIDSESGEVRFRVIGEERWSDEWQIGETVPPEEQPRHLATGICGSGIIEVVAELFLAQVLLPNGRFNPRSQHPRLQWEGRVGQFLLATADQSAGGKPIMITQNDVRNVQLAKGALYAGARLLMNRAGVEKVDRVLLAGAFGSYIDPRHAMILGLIPDCELENVTAVGNAAGDGARIALLNRHKRAEAGELARRVTYIETAVDPEFQERFVDALHLPHASDPFPHLEGILPDPPAAQSAAQNDTGKRRRRRNRRRTADG